MKPMFRQMVKMIGVAAVTGCLLMGCAQKSTPPVQPAAGTVNEAMPSAEAEQPEQEKNADSGSGRTILLGQKITIDQLKVDDYFTMDMTGGHPGPVFGGTEAIQSNDDAEGSQFDRESSEIPEDAELS
jgi:hypothetical protein